MVLKEKDGRHNHPNDILTTYTFVLLVPLACLLFLFQELRVYI